jgi:hypothetical protein
LEGIVMKKFLLAVGVAIGFVLGSRAGRGPYEQLEAKVKDLTGRSSVQDAVSAIEDAMQSVSDKATKTIGEKVDEAAQHFSEAAEKSADKVTKTLGAN